VVSANEKKEKRKKRIFLRARKKLGKIVDQFIYHFSFLSAKKQENCPIGTWGEDIDGAWCWWW
jgi:hypothetical protein